MAKPSGKRYKQIMKLILLLTCVVTLLSTSGCLVEGRGRHGGGAVIVPVAPVVVVHPAAEVIVR
jgi:hypothetical protein